MCYDFITKYTDIFVEKNERSFSHIFSTKILTYFRYFTFETLTNDVISFEQPGHNDGIDCTMIEKNLNY